MSKLYACQGKKQDGSKCMELFDGSKPSVCPVCGSSDIRAGIENLSYEQKLIWQQKERTKHNNSVTSGYRLKRGR
jgi:hypothetical protein